jgi:hypothetical protein
MDFCVRAVSCPIAFGGRSPELSTGRRVGLSFITRVVAGSNPASSLRSKRSGEKKAARRSSAERRWAGADAVNPALRATPRQAGFGIVGRSSSGVKHVFPVRFLSVGFFSEPNSVGYRCDRWL